MVTTAMAVSSLFLDPVGPGQPLLAAGRQPDGSSSVVAGQRVLPALTPGASGLRGGPWRLRDVARGEPWRARCGIERAKSTRTDGLHP